MNVTEVALVVIALATLCTGGAAVAVALRLGAMSREIEPLITDARFTLRRLDGIAGDLEHVASGARRLEGGISAVVSGPLRSAGAVVQGLGAGLMTLLSPTHTHRSSTERGRP